MVLLGGIIATIRAGTPETVDDLIRVIRQGTDMAQIAFFVDNLMVNSPGLYQAFENIDFDMDDSPRQPTAGLETRPEVVDPAGTGRSTGRETLDPGPPRPQPRRPPDKLLAAEPRPAQSASPSDDDEGPPTTRNRLGSGSDVRSPSSNPSTRPWELP